MLTKRLLLVKIDNWREPNEIHLLALSVAGLHSSIPPPIIKSFHEGMEAVVRVGDTVTNRFEVGNGQHQGCTKAPTLFNLYINPMVPVQRDQCDEV